MLAASSLKISCALLLGAAFSWWTPAVSAGPLQKPPAGARISPPDLGGGIGWINSAGPIRLEDLRGKIVVLDFWTLC